MCVCIFSSIESNLSKSHDFLLFDHGTLVFGTKIVNYIVESDFYSVLKLVKKPFFHFDRKTKVPRKITEKHGLFECKQIVQGYHLSDFEKKLILLFKLKLLFLML